MKRIYRKHVPTGATTVSSHVVYIIKVENDKSLSLKARIAPHGKEGSKAANLRSDRCKYSITGIHIVLTLASVQKWRLVKIDVGMAFHQSSPSNRMVFARSLVAWKIWNQLWLLLVAGYGLVHTNYKWQSVFDAVFHKLDSEHLSTVPQLFVKSDSWRNVVLLVIKTVDDIIDCGTQMKTHYFAQLFRKAFKLEIVVMSPACFRFYGMWTVQHAALMLYWCWWQATRTWILLYLACATTQIQGCFEFKW